MKKLFLMMLGTGITQLSFAQIRPNFPQNLVDMSNYSRYAFDLPKKGKLFIAARRPEFLEQFKNIDSVLVAFSKDYETLKPALEASTNTQTATYTILPDGKHQLDLKTYPTNENRYLFNGNYEPLAVKYTQDTLIIVRNAANGNLPQEPPKGLEFLNGSMVYFYFLVNNLDDISALAKNENINAKIEQALADVKNETNHKHFSEKVRFNYMESLKFQSPKDSVRALKSGIVNAKFWNTQFYRGDFLAVHQYLGLGYLGNQWAMSFEQDLSFVPSRYHSVGYTYGWRQIYSSTPNLVDGGFKTTIDQFMHIGLTFYDFKRGKTMPEVDRGHILGGFYVGYLTSGYYKGGRNSIFNSNTFSLHAIFSIKGIVKVEPELYFTGFFKNAFPGLRVQVGF